MLYLRMSKTKTVLRVDVYPAEWADDGQLRYRWRVVDAQHVPFAVSAKSYARTASAWRDAFRLKLDPVDIPSAHAPELTKPKTKTAKAIKRR